jgi:hypothetical protein
VKSKRSKVEQNRQPCLFVMDEFDEAQASSKLETKRPFDDEGALQSILKPTFLGDRAYFLNCIEDGMSFFIEVDQFTKSDVCT